MATHRRNDLLISATPLRESPCKAFSRVRGTAPAQRINGQRRKCWTLARASVGGWAGEKEGRGCDCVYWWRVLYVLIDRPSREKWTHRNFIGEVPYSSKHSAHLGLGCGAAELRQPDCLLLELLP